MARANMKLELTEEEVQLLLTIFESISAQGTAAMRKIVALEDKLKKETEKPKK